MHRFSVIIPVYNVEEYLDKCLISIANQTFLDFEVIIVCDECSDNSENIVDKYINKNNFKKIKAIKTGLSKARNIGIKEAKGEYLLFLDGDDYLEENALEVINNNLYDSPDILRFQAREIGNEIIEYKEVPFSFKDGVHSFNIIRKFHYVENAWLYVYKKTFWNNNKFLFAENKIAEDYGLIPYVISKSKSLRCIDFIGYNYVQRNNSLMNNDNYDKKIKKLDDMFEQANIEKEKLINIKNNKIVNAYLNLGLIYYSCTLKYKDYRKYRKKLKKEKCFDYLEKSSLKQRIKSFLIKHFTYFFINYYGRKS